MSAALPAQAGEPLDTANPMIENLIATIAIPVGVATGLQIDGRDRLVPMATEESWIVSAAGRAGQACRGTGGRMIAQVPSLDVAHPLDARLAILERRAEIAAAFVAAAVCAQAVVDGTLELLPALRTCRRRGDHLRLRRSARQQRGDPGRRRRGVVRVRGGAVRLVVAPHSSAIPAIRAISNAN